MKVLVTGGAGFIGSAIIWGLNKRGIHDILLVDRTTDPQSKKNLSGLSYSKYVQKDEFIATIINSAQHEDTDVIFHMGACSDTTETNEQYLVENNFEYTKHLAKFAIKNSIKFIYASSSATYGDGSAGYIDNLDTILTLKPLNLYGKSKQDFDIWAFQNKLFDKIVGLKFFNVFGPNEYHKGNMRSLICKGYHEIIETGKLSVFKPYREDYKNGEQVRDFVYIKDVIDMVLFFLDNLTLSGIFNIGSGTPSSFNSLGTKIFDALNITKNIEYINMPISIRDKYQYCTETGIGKIIEAGYDNSIRALTDSVQDYVKNYLQPGKYLS